MTELEIINFAHAFCNLINNKNREIGCLKEQNKKLQAVVNELLVPGKRLSEKDIRNAKQPVFCFHVHPFNSKDCGFWGVPLDDNTGVITNRIGVMRYENYEKTWYAMTSEMIGG
jgi:hypothetical protein